MTHENYNPFQKGKKTIRVRWVNKAGKMQNQKKKDTKQD